MTTKLNIHLEDPVSTKQSDESFTILTPVAAVAKFLITENNAKR
jgi:hypothetical protein